ncbi:VTT domain-containing protein [Micromonospora sp. NPDC049679]|uniref:TVP38/TMEM64 family protein n=1 Tax=Micromonospora sp. NPDC049679 TaxID=3155920 RepID=UPI00340E1C9E
MTVSATPADPPTPPEPEPRSGRRLRLVALALAVGALALVAALLPLEKVGEAAATLGPATPVVAVTVGAMLLAALVPRTAISLGSGALFGPLVGGSYALLAAVLAAVVTFVAGRWAGRDYLAARAGGRLARLDHWLARRGVLAVVVVRLLPVSPFGMVGYAYGTTSVRTRHYLIGTLIGATPSAFSYAAIGATVVKPGHVDLLTFIPAALGTLVSISAAVYWRVSGRRQHGRPG